MSLILLMYCVDGRLDVLSLGRKRGQKNGERIPKYRLKENSGGFREQQSCVLNPRGISRENGFHLACPQYATKPNISQLTALHPPPPSALFFLSLRFASVALPPPPRRPNFPSLSSQLQQFAHCSTGRR